MSGGMRRDGIQAHAASEAPPLVFAGEWRIAAAVAWRALWSSRLLIWLCGVASVTIWGYSSRAADFAPASLTRPYGAAGNALVAVFARWDSVWYLAIARNGYPGADGPRTAFFPLYPLLVRAGGATPVSPLLAGALISTACFGAALVLLHRLTALELGTEAAGATVRAGRGAGLARPPGRGRGGAVPRPGGLAPPFRRAVRGAARRGRGGLRRRPSAALRPPQARVLHEGRRRSVHGGSDEHDAVRVCARGRPGRGGRAAAAAAARLRGVRRVCAGA